jgi:hypothetical protein
MKKDIIGTFVFRNEGDGCLTSKYFHEGQPYPFVEACKRLREDGRQNDMFSGEYKATWIQEPFAVISAMLTIHWDPNQNTYTLSWVGVSNNTPMFNGIGMIYDGLLVGAYWNI